MSDSITAYFRSVAVVAASCVFAAINLIPRLENALPMIGTAGDASYAGLFEYGWPAPFKSGSFTANYRRFNGVVNLQEYSSLDFVLSPHLFRVDESESSYKALVVDSLVFALMTGLVALAVRQPHRQIVMNFRFSLKTLLFTVLVISAFFGGRATMYSEKQSDILRLRARHDEERADWALKERDASHRLN